MWPERWLERRLLQRERLVERHVVDEYFDLLDGRELQRGLLQLGLHARIVAHTAEVKRAAELDRRLAIDERDTVHVQPRGIQHIYQTGLAIVAVVERQQVFHRVRQHGRRLCNHTLNWHHRVA